MTDAISKYKNAEDLKPAGVVGRAAFVTILSIDTTSPDQEVPEHTA
eukprot:CAMPEP_0177776758 /NCGR_PEP_ID=MMETSP0491_2-20121128/14897_1 /TAXON_ID=63592 /ORGANISM="Tetraselmis chuii, Strain PLY429" /LENGTH=45 /DNA_ID= /DNA_START= /DNA_END= /DNA_ORIENTATION=